MIAADRRCWRTGSWVGQTLLRELGHGRWTSRWVPLNSTTAWLFFTKVEWRGLVSALFFPQRDLLRAAFCWWCRFDSLPFLPSAPDIECWSYLWRLHHLREVDPISCSLFPQVRKQMTEKSAGEFWVLTQVRAHTRIHPHTLCCSVCCNSHCGGFPVV